MATLVLNRDSMGVRLESNHLVVHDYAVEGSFTRVPLGDIDRVIVVGQPAITFPVLAKFLDNGVPCTFLTNGGRWRGMMDGDPGFHAERRQRQYQRIDDPSFSLELARGAVAAKMANSRRTIQRLAVERGDVLYNDPEWHVLEKLKGEIGYLTDANSLRGAEGCAAKTYFKLLGRFFPSDMQFVTRTRRPPRDEANALLSFVYTLLANTFIAAVRAHGLDVSKGFFHRGFDRAPALALDLMEPFRSAWVDRLVLCLANHRRIRKGDHFSKEGDCGIYLNEAGRKVVFHAFGEMMERKQKTDAGRMSRRQIADMSVARFAAVLESGEKYDFFKAG